jgi:hypothetical protein
VWQLPGLKSWNAVARGLLGDWQLSGLVQAQTGRPLTVLQGSNISGTGIGQDRGTFTGVNPYSSGPCAGVAPCRVWLNPAAFILSASDPRLKNSFGNVGKGSLRFPGFYSWDMGLSKTISVTERWKLQLRGEFFNIFNHPNFANPDGGICLSVDPATHSCINPFTGLSTVNGNFGRSTATVASLAGGAVANGTARQIQFSLKFMF